MRRSLANTADRTQVELVAGTERHTTQIAVRFHTKQLVGSGVPLAPLHADNRRLRARLAGARAQAAQRRRKVANMIDAQAAPCA